MKVKYLGESDPLSFIKGKVYEVLSIEYGYYRIVDETDEDSLYCNAAFNLPSFTNFEKFAKKG